MSLPYAQVIESFAFVKGPLNVYIAVGGSSRISFQNKAAHVLYTRGRRLPCACHGHRPCTYLVLCITEVIEFLYSSILSAIQIGINGANVQFDDA